MVTVGDPDTGETRVLQYTDVDGSVVTADLVLHAGLEVVQEQGVVFGETLGQFVVLAGHFEELENGTVQPTYSLIEVDVDENRVPGLGTVQPFVAGFRPAIGPTEASIYALGDGRIGYEHGISGSDLGISHGVVTDDGDAISVDPLAGDVNYQAAIVALDDGGILLVEQEPGTLDGEFQVKQFDATGVEMASQSFPTAGVYDETGFVEDEMSSVVLINGTGELEVFFTKAGDADAETYTMVFDLLPLAEEIIDEGVDPVDPVDPNEPTEGDDVIDAYLPNGLVEGLGGDDIIGSSGTDSTIFGGEGDDDIAAPGLIYGGDGDEQITTNFFGATV